MPIPNPLRVAFTRDHLDEQDQPAWPGLGVDGWDQLPEAEVRFLDERYRHATPAHLNGYDAIITSTAKYDASSFQDLDRLVALCRFGVGYDAIDVAAATDAGIMVTITRGAPDRPMAEGALTLMLALGHQVVAKDRLMRAGGWATRSDYRGVELRDRVIGIVGFGGIGRELARLLQGFGPARILAFDPQPHRIAAAKLGVELVGLRPLLEQSDFVSIHCPLTSETRKLIGAEQLSWMKPTAFLINTARGPIFDQDALLTALRTRAIRGAALDVFEVEPLEPHHPLLELDNVVVTPHHVGVTDELFRDYQFACIEALKQISRGELPRAFLVNPEVAEHPRLQEWLRRRREAAP